MIIHEQMWQPYFSLTTNIIWLMTPSYIYYEFNIKHHIFERLSKYKGHIANVLS